MFQLPWRYAWSWKMASCIIIQTWSPTSTITIGALLRDTKKNSLLFLRISIRKPISIPSSRRFGLSTMTVNKPCNSSWSTRLIWIGLVQVVLWSYRQCLFPYLSRSAKRSGQLCHSAENQKWLGNQERIHGLRWPQCYRRHLLWWGLYAASPHSRVQPFFLQPSKRGILGWHQGQDDCILLSERLLLCSASLWRPTHGGKLDVCGGLRDEIPCHTPSAVHAGEHSENQKDLSNAKCIRRGDRGRLLRDTD